MGVLSNIASISLGPNTVAPASGNTYKLNNLAFDHWLDNAGSDASDGNQILAWSLDVPQALNQEVRIISLHY